MMVLRKVKSMGIKPRQFYLDFEGNYMRWTNQREIDSWEYHELSSINHCNY